MMMFGPTYICKFCYDRGCIACEGERQRRFDKSFPNGPEPIFVAKTIEDVALLIPAFSADALKERYERHGGDMGEFFLETLKEVAAARDRQTAAENDDDLAGDND